MTEASVITEDEGRARSRRAMLLLPALLVIGSGFAISTGIHEGFAAEDLLGTTLALGFVLFGVSMSASSQITLGPAAGLVGTVAFLSPLVAASTMTDEAGVGGVACLVSLAAVGLVALVASRWILGPHRRRSGGAKTIQGVAAAMTASFGVGLHCPSGSALHLGTHCAGAFLVAVALRRVILR